MKIECKNPSNWVEFLEKAKEIFGDLYEYNKPIDIKRTTDKVSILCRKHNKEFIKEVRCHINNKKGCPECGKEESVSKRTMSLETFKEKANKIHNYKYNYDDVIYENYQSKIKIFCDKHGLFEQTVGNHLKGYGCVKCNGLGLTTEEFIKKCVEAHGNKYDYSRVIFKNKTSKITIGCPMHKWFKQKAYNHMNGANCRKCTGNIKSSNDEFIKKAIKVHGHKYEYSKVVYKNAHAKVIIFCKKHKKYFEKMARQHLMGRGCPFCGESTGETKIRSILEGKKIKYIKEKTFDDCKNKASLMFDFYLPEHNSIIEYDGIQHFKPIGFFGGENGYKSLLVRDNIKNEYCRENNIHILRIPYTEKNNSFNIISVFISSL